MVGLGDEEGMYPVEELDSEEGTLLVVEVGGEEESSIDFDFVFILVCVFVWLSRLENRVERKDKEEGKDSVVEGFLPNIRTSMVFYAYITEI